MTALAPQAQAAQEFGAKLFDALFANDARIALRRTFDLAAMQNTGVRIRLHVQDAPELANLPWEFLYDESTQRFLALSPDTPIVRYLDTPQPARPLAMQPPLRILAVFASPNDFAPLDTEREWQGLNDALGELTTRGLVELQRLERAAIVDLHRTMQRSEIHILHIIGHGSFDVVSDEGFLALEDEKGYGRQVSAQALGTLLGDFPALRLVTLMTSQGARVSTVNPFSGIAPALIRQGIPAVIGMQFEVSDTAALTFTHEFYTALADGFPVDAAVTKGRRAIFEKSSEIEWATPVLYTRARDGVLFDVQSPQARTQLAPHVAVSGRGSKAEAAEAKPARETKSAKPKTARQAAAKTAVVETGQLEPDTILQGHYRVERKISESELSRVYLAHDERRGGKQCALKELKSGGDKPTPRRVELFKQNAEILSSLAHPSLPRVTDFFEFQARFYYVMDFIEGNTLEQFLAQRGRPYAVEQVLQWANELCNALSYLHSQTPPFIHGNISPETILRAKDGRLVLLGMNMFPLYLEAQKTGGPGFGTPGYIAPEQIKGRVTVQSDIYALGVTLHNLLTAYDPVDALFDVPPASKLNRAVPAHIADALAVAYATDPKARYASAADFQRALQEPPQKNLFDRLLRR